MSGQAVACLGAERNGCIAKREALCDVVVAGTRAAILPGSIICKGQVIQSQIYCDSLTMSFMLNLATAEQTCSLSVTGFHFLLLSSESVTPLLQNLCKRREDFLFRMAKGHACTMEWPVIRAQLVSRFGGALNRKFRQFNINKMAWTLGI